MSNSRLLLYNPDQKSKRQLVSEFVIRQKEFNMVLKDLSNSSLKTSPQHYLIVGQRGMGKTTLMLRIKYAIEDSSDLNSWIIPVRFNEEQYQIATLERLWEELADLIETADESFAGLLKQMESLDETENYERNILQVLINTLKKRKKRVVIFLDNLGDLFRKFTDVENHRLREVLVSHTEIQLIAASSVALEHTFSYDKPFFEFFQQILLQPVTKDSALDLLTGLGKQYNKESEVVGLIAENPAKIEVLRRLTGGVPRTIGLLFGIFIDHRKGTTFEDLLLLLDEVNTLYKQRMDDMKPQQQRIVDALAKAWDPISSKEVLERSKLAREGVETNQIAAQLNILTANQIVEALGGKGKKTYRIRERFFNIWYLMRYGKKEHREEVLWLVRFLETWFTRRELNFQVQEQVKALKEGNYSTRAAYIKAMALYHTSGVKFYHKLKLLEHTENYLNRSADEATAGVIKKTKRKELDRCVADLLEKHTNSQNLKLRDIPDLNAESLIYLINSISQKLHAEEKPLMSIRDLLSEGIRLKDPASMDYMGAAYEESDPDEAEKYYLMAIDNGYIEAMFHVAFLYLEKKNDIPSAEKYHLMASEGAHALAKSIYERLKNEVRHDLVEETGPGDRGEKPELQEAEKYFVQFTLNLAQIYDGKNDVEAAIRYYLMVVETGNALAMNHLGVLYESKKNDLISAERFYLMAADKGFAEAMFNLGLLYETKRNDPKSAEKYYLMAAGEKHSDAAVRLALIYWKMKKNLQSVENYFQSAHSLGNIKGSVNLVLFYSVAGRTEDMLKISDDLLNSESILGNREGLLKIILEILIRKQYHFLLQHFQKPESPLLKHIRPLYYVLVWFMKDELPGEYEKVGSEIKETVDEIIQQVQQQQQQNEVYGGVE